MASSPPPEPNKPLISDYFSQLRNTLLRILPSSSGVSTLLAKIASVLQPSRRPRKPRRRKTGLPLPLRSLALASSSVTNETSIMVGVLDDILDHILTSMHEIQKNLQFWQSRAEGTDAQKVYFMVFERGPRVFVNETIHIVSRYATEGSSIQNLCYSAATSIYEKISILSSLQYCLATFLAQLYIEADKHEEQLIRDPYKAFASLLIAVNTLFLKLGTSVAHRRELYVDDSCALTFEKLPDFDNERSDWSYTSVKNAMDLIYQNLEILDSYTTVLVSHCQKPRRLTLYWLRYTCGAVGLSLGTFWLLRHSRFMGSSDIDDWLREAKESVAGFWKSHVEQPLISIRDELFETFRRRHKSGVIEVEEVKLTEDSLHRMLLAFSEQTKSQKFPVNASDQEMLEIVMARYEKELMHPIQNLFSGEIARAMLIQIQKLKLDLETAMLELDQILKANEINFAILAALPAFFLSVITLMLVRAWFLQDKGAEGRGRLARLHRRLLVAEIEKKIMRYQTCIDQGLEEDALKMFGLVLYSLDRLYKASERNATETGEWSSLKQDILDIGNPGMRVEHKLVLTSRMERVYECMLPSLKRH